MRSKLYISHHSQKKAQDDRAGQGWVYRPVLGFADLHLTLERLINFRHKRRK